MKCVALVVMLANLPGTCCRPAQEEQHANQTDGHHVQPQQTDDRNVTEHESLGNSSCCFYRCRSCQDPGDYCSASKERCIDCGGHVCTAAEVDAESSPEEQQERAREGQQRQQERERDQQERTHERQQDEQERERQRQQDEQERQQQQEERERERQQDEQEDRQREGDETNFERNHTCCYGSNCTECEHPHDWCSMSLARCTDCGGAICNVARPTTEAPTTEAPTTEAPTTGAPTTEAPTTAEVTEAPATAESVSNEVDVFASEPKKTPSIGVPDVVMVVAASLLSMAVVIGVRQRRTQLQTPLLTDESLCVEGA